MRAALATRPAAPKGRPLLAPSLLGPPLLDPGGAAVVLGDRSAAPVAPLAPAAHTLFGPRGACLIAPEGPLAVCDTGHHRLLIWTRRPAADNAPADLVIGQPDFQSEGRNGHGAAGPATLNVPTGVAAAAGVLAVADAWNHRVLLWHGTPARANQPADVVLGQADFASTAANRGGEAPRADTLHWCYGVALHAGRLFVADTGNRRVLVWNRIPTANGTAADLVLGQPDFTCRDESAGGAVSGIGMRWPHALAIFGEGFAVADAGHHRVLVWHRMPDRAETRCDVVLGQPDHARSEANRAGPPRAGSLNQPFGLAVLGDRLVVADTANSRLLGFALRDLAMGGEAATLAGQDTFGDNGENRWGDMARDSLSWPYGVSACGAQLAISDTGNNRVLLWSGA